MAKHGITFSQAVAILAGPVLDLASPRPHSTESRRIAFGLAERRVLAVVYVLVEQNTVIGSSQRARRNDGNGGNMLQDERRVGLPGGPVTLEQAAAMPRVPIVLRTDAAIQAEIDADVDAAPVLTNAKFAGASWVYPAGKVLISLRVDANVLDAYKATGRGWQTRMNDALAASVAPVGSLQAAAHQLQEIAGRLTQMGQGKP